MLDVLPGLFHRPSRLLRPSILLTFSGAQYLLPVILKFNCLWQFAKAKTYDYHPPMPAPDSEAPEQSLGDCSICMDTIFVESPNNSNEKGQTNDGTNTVSGGFFSAVQRGVTGGATGAKKSYSLAPCHHLFVSQFFLCRKATRSDTSSSIRHVLNA